MLHLQKIIFSSDENQRDQGLKPLLSHGGNQCMLHLQKIIYTNFRFYVTFVKNNSFGVFHVTFACYIFAPPTLISVVHGLGVETI